MDDLKCPVVGCKREFSNRFNRDEHAEKCRREWQAGKRAKHGQQSMFGFFSKAQPAAAAADPASVPKLQQKGGVNATEVAEALPYKDSLGQPVFCQLLSHAEVRGQQSCLICKALVKVDSMREHVGSHVLQEHVSSDVCGFCGGTSCTPYLTAKEQPGQPESCPSYAKFSSAPCKKDRGQCNNVPLLCPECIDGRKQVAWQHTMQPSTRIRVWRMGSHLRWVPRK